MRLPGWDTYRGFLLILAVAGQTLAVFPLDGHEWFRLYVTRICFPGLLFAAGIFLARRSSVSTAQLVIYATVSTFCTVYLEIDGINTLGLYALIAILGSSLILSFPVVALSLGLVQATHDYLTFPFSGYQPGAVVVMLAAGVLFRRSVDRIADFPLPRLPLVSWLGRFPSETYTLSLVVLVGVVAWNG